MTLFAHSTMSRRSNIQKIRIKSTSSSSSTVYHIIDRKNLDLKGFNELTGIMTLNDDNGKCAVGNRRNVREDEKLLMVQERGEKY